MVKSKIKKDQLEKLDEVNCLWILRQLSLGNLLRGAAYVMRMFEDIRICLTKTYHDIKKKNEEHIDLQIEKTQERPKPRSKKG